MVHDAHDCILVPPLWILDTFDFAPHNDDLTGRDQLAAAICRSKVLRHSGGLNIAVQSLSKPVNHLGSLARSEDVWRARSQHEVSVQIHNKCIRRSSKECTTFRGDTKDVWPRLLDKVLGVTGVDNRDIETTPFVYSNAKSNRFSGNGEHRGIMTNENYTACWRYCRFNYTHNVRNRQTGEQRPHGKVLETCRRGWELVAQSIILHVDSHEIIQSRSRETQNTGYFLRMEKVGSLVPVDPHATEVISQQVVQRIAGKETQTVWDPVGLLRVVVEIWLRLLA